MDKYKRPKHLMLMSSKNAKEVHQLLDKLNPKVSLDNDQCHAY